jgi:hypothetical protein
MKVLKLGLVAALLAIFVVGCTITPVGTHTEADDAGNGSSSTAEDTGFTANDWYAIEGTISSEFDFDYYRVALPSGAATLDFTVYYEGDKVKGILGISLFPFSFVTYDADDTVLSISLL